MKNAFVVVRVDFCCSFDVDYAHVPRSCCCQSELGPDCDKSCVLGSDHKCQPATIVTPGPTHHVVCMLCLQPLKKELNRVILCLACSSTWFYSKHWKATFRAGKKGLGIYLSDTDCLTNMSFADDVLLFASCKISNIKCCANSGGVLAKCDSGLIQER